MTMYIDSIRNVEPGEDFAFIERRDMLFKCLHNKNGMFVTTSQHVFFYNHKMIDSNDKAVYRFSV